MRKMVLLAGLLTALATPVSGQPAAQPAQSSRQDGVAERGDQVMGFSHNLTTHHFRLLKDGGEIVVVANGPKDKTSIEQIRIHLNHIARMFSDGNFDAPMLIHDSNPPGATTMARLKSQIRYTVSDTAQGGKIRILTSSPETTDAVHAFLLFQIVDHKTGDSPAIAE